MKTIQFNKVDDSIYVSTAVEFVTDTMSGSSVRFSRVFRIDGRGGQGYRVDISGFNGGWWEAIDGGTPIKSLKDAKAFVRVFQAAATAQRTITPQIPR